MIQAKVDRQNGRWYFPIKKRGNNFLKLMNHDISNVG